MNGLFVLLAAIGLLAAFLTWAFFTMRERMRLNAARTKAMTLYHGPGRISLRRLDPFRWLKAERAEQRMAAFRALGFEDVCGFALAGDATARLFILRHPRSGQLGIVQESGRLGTWSDVAWFRADTCQPIFASNVLNKSHFFLFPGDPRIHLPDAPEAGLVSAVAKAADPGGRPLVLTAENAAPVIEEAYAAAVDARLLEPLADSELRRLLKDQQDGCEGDEMSDAEIQRIRKQLPLVVGHKLRLACRDQFLREGSISAREWQEAKARLLVVHDRTPLHELGEHTGWFAHHRVEFCRPRLKERLAASVKQPDAPRSKFAVLNAALPPWERYRKLGEVSRPVPADLYCAPAERQST